MANRDVLKDIMLQMQNLRLSSPLRTDQSKDDNKENMLAGQDIQKPRSEEKSTDTPIILVTQADENKSIQLDCQEINGIDVNSYGKSEGTSPATPLITSSVSENTVSNFVISDALIKSDSLVNGNNALNATVSSEVTNSELNKPEENLNLTNCELKTSTQSLYDDCIDVIGKNPEEHEIDPNSVKKVSDDPLNSTYCVEETFLSLQETEELPLQNHNQTELKTVEETNNLNCTQVIEEDSNTTIVKDGGISIDLLETSNCGEKLQSDISHENSGIFTDQSERCDHTFIEHTPDTEPLPIVENSDETLSESLLPAVSSENLDLVPVSNKEETYTESTKNCKDLDASLSKSVEQNISTNSSDSETSLVNITKTNCSIEDLEASTANLVSDSSNRSLNTSLNSTQVSELNNSSSQVPSLNINISAKEVNVPLIDQQNHSETTSNPEPIECCEKLDSSTNQVANKSSSAFIVLTPPKSEDKRIFSEILPTKNSLTEILGQKSCEESCDLPQSSNSSSVNKTVEEIDNSSVVTENIEHSCVEVKDVSSTLAIETVDEQEVDNKVEVTSNIPDRKMEEINEKLQQEFSDTKLELNAIQQAKATLELEISKKDEIILKTQAESMKKEQHYVQEIKGLKEQLKEKANSIIEKDSKESKDSLKDLEEALKEAKAKEVDFMKVLEEYEKTIATRFAEYKKLKEENVTLNRHLSNLELSFSDLHQKYEKAKTVIFGYKRNEEQLREAFNSYQETFRKQEGRYESLKAHAQTQIDKCNVEILQQKDKSDSDINKLKAIVKRLEIKNAALETSLDQKTKECIALAALCDEVTGKKF